MARRSQITLAVLAEKRERFEQALKDKDPAEYREYAAEKNYAIEDRRNEVTGY